MSGQLSAEEPLSTVDDPSAPSGVGFGDGGDALIADIGPSPISPRQIIPKDDEPNDSEIRFMGVHDAEDYEPLVDIDEIPDLLMRDGRDSTSSSGLRSGNTSEARRRSPPRLPPDPPEPPRASATDAPSAPEFLMLSELKDLLPQAPHDPPSAYAYRHGISASYTSEIEEWFGLEDDGELVLQAQASFERRWYSGPNKASGDAKSEPPTFWSTRTPATMRANFIQSAGHAVEGSRGPRRYDALLCLLNIALGDWSDTIERQLASDNTHDTEGSSNPMHFDGVGEMPKMRIFRITNLHRLRMIEGAELLSTYDAIPVIYDVLREVAAAKPDTDDRSKGKVEDREESGSSGNASDTLEVVLLILYLLVEAGRELRRRGMDTSIKSEIAALEPDYLPYFVKMLAKLRWSDSSDLPLSKLLLIYWKSLLLLLGSEDDLQSTKKCATTQAGLEPCSKDKQIRSSPLDYHLFRQEIISKFPGYCPPPAQLPLAPEESMLLPSFTEQAKKKIARHEVIPSFAPNTSIFEQPVHIATPAPSPPPTPVGGGKTLRKINYQTNQQFPMLYPPVNVSGDPFGDSMPSDLPNYDSSKDWDADFVPASILEAGNLFSQRSRLTLASKQLWDEKECYLAYERGLSQETAGVQVSGADTANKTEKPISDNERLERRNAQWRLEFIEDFYHQTFAHMQSFVVVLFKEMQQDVRLLLTPKTSQTSGPGPAIPSADKARRPGPPARTNTSLENMSRPNSLVSEPENGKQQTRQEIAETRSLEISLKAISGIFLTMLRWFKVSHVLKFEYLAQLLFDIDFVSRALIYVSQDLDVTVNGCPDNPQDGFFNYCIHHSGNDPAPDDDDDTSSDSDDSEDPACPPPIKLKRGTTDSDAPVQPWSHTPPEVDELGNPVDPEHPLPLEPVKYFSFRTLFTTINVLQILQKLTKGKTHRNIALVNFKSSHYLARALRIPQPDLRLYTLKLYKGQVPFCGRKWRQGNMRVITAVYLYCWPELRDEWLYGGDVERRVEEALPMEQSLRALTHWYNARRYPERFRLLDADGKGLRKEEQDFFERELESMGLGSMQLEDLQDEGDGGAAPAAPVAPGPRTQAEAQAQRLQQQQQQRQQQQRADGMAGPR